MKLFLFEDNGLEIWLEKRQGQWFHCRKHAFEKQRTVKAVSFAKALQLAMEVSDKLADDVEEANSATD